MPVKTAQNRPASPSHFAEALSFMHKENGNAGIAYWEVQTTGNYEGDCRRGRDLAEEFTLYVAKHPTYGNMVLLTSIVGAMSERLEALREELSEWNRLTGLEIGFLNHLGRYLALGAMVAHIEDPKKVLEGAA